MSTTLNNPLTILMVAPQPFFRARGTPFSVLHRIRALIEAGHSVDLITYPFGEDIEFPRFRITRSARIPLVKDIRIGPSIAKLFLDFPLYLTTRRALKTRTYDVLHTHEEAAFFGVGLARKYGLPHIYDMHSSLPQQLANFESFNLAPIRGVFARLEDYVLSNSDGVITICQDLADVVTAHGTPIPHSMIENTGDDAKIFGGNRRDVRNEFGLGDRQIVLYTGTLEAYQGIDILLKSMAIMVRNLPEAHLLIVGGRQEQIEHYRQQAVDLGIAGKVTFTGMVSPTDIPSFIEAADVIASPRSSGTNTPLKIYGYMRTGRAIVATDLPTHTQTLDRNISHLVAPDPESFAGGLVRVLQDREFRETLAKAAIERADEHFSDAGYLRKVHDFYASVMRRRAGNAQESGFEASVANR